MSDPDSETSGEDRHEGERQDAYERERLATREEGAATLRRLADGVAAGSVEFGEEGLEATVPEQFEIEVEFERDDEEAEIEVEIEWPIAEGESVAVEPEMEAHSGSDTGDAETDTGDRDADGEANDQTDRGDERGSIEKIVGAGDVAESQAQFELFRDRANEWRWRLVHDNGNIIADSGEGYDRKASARNGLESVMRNAPGAPVVEDDSNQ